MLRFSLPGACCDAINIFGKPGIKENLAEKLKQIAEIEVSSDCDGSSTNENLQEILYGKATVQVNGVKKKETTVSVIDFCSVFNLKLLSLSALVKVKSSALLNNKERDENEMAFFDHHPAMIRFVVALLFLFWQLRVHPKASHFSSPPLFMFSFPS